MEQLTIKELYQDLDQTLAKELLEKYTYPWEVLPHISEFIVALGNSLDEKEYEKRGENIWIAKSAKVAPTAYITRPGYHRKRCRGAPLRIHQRKRSGGGRGRGRQLHRT